MNFPNGFKEKYQHLLGEDAAAFFATFDQEAVSAFRTNPLKEAQKAFDDPIHNTPWGHYGKVSGKSIEHATGLVYSQEPAAQIVAQVAQPKPGMKVLDLAAAPGGKQLLAERPPNSCLIWTIRDSWSPMKSTRAARKFL